MPASANLHSLITHSARRPWLVGAGAGVQVGSDACVLMGILNCTPDSFHDGGLHFDSGAAVARAMEMVEQGARILDIGGESTRPGAADVSVSEELRRTIPVLRRLSEMRRSLQEQNPTQPPPFLLSIDTTKAAVAEAALAEGCDIVNDVSAGKLDREMLRQFAQPGVSCVLNHMRGTPRTMQLDPGYQDVVAEVSRELLSAAEPLLAAGVPPERICLDPGIGFGKRWEDNMDLLAACTDFCALGFPILYGLSRKSWVPRTPGLEGSDRLQPSIAAGLLAALGGATVLRVHDVHETREALRVLEGLQSRALAGISSGVTT